MHRTWIVVADSARARIFERDGRWQPLAELQGLAHPESRLHHGDLKTGGRGEQQESTGRASHASDWSTTPSQQEAKRFAREVADTLHEGRTQNRFERLVLVAAPAFLGRLRDKLDGPTQHCVTQTLDKNWARHATPDIQGLLEQHF
ncbi:MAG: host attachment protein [Salinisphaeraceae bacterium]